jgi:hypothetical protein
MTRFVLISAAMFGLASLTAPAPAAAQDIAGVTGAAEAAFPDGASFAEVSLQGLTLGMGVSIGADGSAEGQFQAVLQGSSLLGEPQEILVEGEVDAGDVADGVATFSGTASLEGVPGVPFSVTASTEGLTLILDGTELPAAAVTAGSITLE